jgi:hypothetical protein
VFIVAARIIAIMGGIGGGAGALGAAAAGGAVVSPGTLSLTADDGLDRYVLRP